MATTATKPTNSLVNCVLPQNANQVMFGGAVIVGACGCYALSVNIYRRCYVDDECVEKRTLKMKAISKHTDVARYVAGFGAIVIFMGVICKIPELKIFK